jgi:hypothetical protein
MTTPIFNPPSALALVHHRAPVALSVCQQGRGRQGTKGGNQVAGPGEWSEKNGNVTLDTVIAGIRNMTARLRTRIAGVRVIGATLTSALNSTSPGPRP